MINVQNLSKYYGSKKALGPVSFEIEDGETIGFLGLNGAGKTTALRILACDLRPSAGAVSIGDVDAIAAPHEVRKLIGFLPENTPLYSDMVVRDYLDFAGRLQGMSKRELDKRMPEVLETTDLTEVEHDLIRHLSHGFRQRVGVAQAIVHQPKLLILDEPTRGLDPVQIVEMRNMIHQLKEKHTVLISSHILTEVSQTCDRILVLGEGAIIASGTMDTLAADLASTKRFQVMVRTKPDSDVAAIAESLKQIEHVNDVKPADTIGQTHLFEVLASEEVRPDICRLLVKEGHDVIKLDAFDTELENIFLRLVQGGTSARN